MSDYGKERKLKPTLIHTRMIKESKTRKQNGTVREIIKGSRRILKWVKFSLTLVKSTGKLFLGHWRQKVKVWQISSHGNHHLSVKPDGGGVMNWMYFTANEEFAENKRIHCSALHALLGPCLLSCLYKEHSCKVCHKRHKVRVSGRCPLGRFQSLTL